MGFTLLILSWVGGCLIMAALLANNYYLMIPAGLCLLFTPMLAAKIDAAWRTHGND